MAVTFDAHFEKGSGTASSPFSYVSNAGTVAGSVGANSNRVLIVAVCFGFGSSAGSVTAPTWSGTSTTLITSASTTNAQTFLYGLIAPATGAQTISVAWSGAASNIALGAVSLFNADQTTGWHNSGTDTGTGTSASSTITSANGDMAIASHCNDNASGTSIGTGTSDWIETAFNGNYAEARNPASGASTTIAWTLGSSVAWANAKVDVIAFSGGSTRGLFMQNPLTGTGTGGSFFPNPLQMIDLAWCRG